MSKEYKIHGFKIEEKTVLEMQKSIIKYLKKVEMNQDSVYIIWRIWNFIGNQTAMDELVPPEKLK